MTDTTNDTTIEETTTTEISDKVEALDFKSHISEEYKDKLEDIKDLDSLAKGYINAQSMIGNSLRIPSEDASEEQITKFKEKILSSGTGFIDPTDKDSLNKALGVPEQFTGYDVTEQQLEDSNTKDYLEQAHKLGIGAEQVKGLLKLNEDKNNASIDAWNERVSKTEDSLKQLYGNDLNNRLEGAKQYLNTLSEVDKGYAKDLETLASTNPLITKLLSDAYGKASESSDKTGIGTVKYGLSPDEASAKMMDIRSNPKHPFNIAGHPDEKKAQLAMLELIKASQS